MRKCSGLYCAGLQGSMVYIYLVYLRRKMEIITSKEKIRQILASIIPQYDNSDHTAFINLIEKKLLEKKIKFPLLEFTAKELYNHIPEKEHINLTDEIIQKQQIGGNVIAGIMLQLRLNNHFKESLQKAGQYIIAGDKWYVCDIIGERVMGYALLTQPLLTIPELKKMAAHKNSWMVRTAGVAGHYAVKNGLQKEHVNKLFSLLLSCSHTTDFHARKGIGWAVKTVTKFHPDIVDLYKEKIENDDAIKQWFKTKIKMGMGLSHKYAAKYSG